MPACAIIRIGVRAFRHHVGVNREGIVDKVSVVGGNQAEVVLQAVIHGQRRREAGSHNGFVQCSVIVGQDSEDMKERAQIFLCRHRHAEHSAVVIVVWVFDAVEEVGVFAFPKFLEWTPTHQAHDFKIVSVSAVLIAHFIGGRIGDVPIGSKAVGYEPVGGRSVDVEGVGHKAVHDRLVELLL